MHSRSSTATVTCYALDERDKAKADKAHALDAGLRLCFSQAPLARAGHAYRSAKSLCTPLRSSHLNKRCRPKTTWSSYFRMRFSTVLQ